VMPSHADEIDLICMSHSPGAIDRDFCPSTDVRVLGLLTTSSTSSVPSILTRLDTYRRSLVPFAGSIADIIRY